MSDPDVEVSTSAITVLVVLMCGLCSSAPPGSIVNPGLIHPGISNKDQRWGRTEQGTNKETQEVIRRSRKAPSNVLV